MEMQEATLIYPHQLFKNHPGLAKGRVVYLIEEPLFLTEFPIHTQKLLLHRLSMQYYKNFLEGQGYTVRYLEIQEFTDTKSVFTQIQDEGIKHLHIVDTTDSWLEQRVRTYVHNHGLDLTRYESPLFILRKDEAVHRYRKSGKHMARFYKQLRIDQGLLITDAQEPLGGVWSFDSENRKKVPKAMQLPEDIATQSGKEVQEALMWLKTVTAERYGSEDVWVPWTHESAHRYMQEFLTERLAYFGTYEDALVGEHTRLFHSTLSPLINIGLLTPEEVVHAVVSYGMEHAVPLNNIEGFVRQVIGWREFVRASYECDGSSMRRGNFWNHTQKLSSAFWNGTTGVLPVDFAIQRALRYGYNHHIERLMVLGNFMLLSRIDPNEVYRWFMAMYVDAYDWVMVPNVYGMSQFADGGIFATKPYISGSNYLKKMSDYPSGDWEEIWTALYWFFIETHADFFLSNQRLSMMPKLLERMNTAKRRNYMHMAQEYLKSIK